MPSLSRLSLPHGPPLEALLGQAVRDRRLALGLSQEGLAARCGMDRSFVGEVDRGKRHITTLALVRLAVGLETTPGTLLDAAFDALRTASPPFDEAVRTHTLEPGTR